MKIAAVLAGAVMALAISTPAVLDQGQDNSRADLAIISVPAWLPLPSTSFINSIEHSGEAGKEAAFGTVFYELPSDGASEVNWLKQHLAAKGYDLDDLSSSIDNFAGADVVVNAFHPASGRRVGIVKVNRQDGTNLRVTFEDPQSESDVFTL